MQPKKLLTLFLAVILTCFLAVSIFAVEDDPLTMAVEVSSSTAISSQPKEVVLKAGEVVQVKITVQSAPDISFYEFVLSYDSNAFAIATSDVYEIGSACIQKPEVATYELGKIRIGAFSGLRTGDLITLNFVSKDSFDGVSKFDFAVKTCADGNFKNYTNVEITNNTKLEIHPFAEPNLIPGSCTTTEVKTFNCTKCKYSIEIKGTTPGGHKFDAEKADEKYLKTVATCTTKAVYYKSCSVCGEKDTNTFEYGDMLGHKFDNNVAEERYLKSVATCTAAPVYYKSCSVCKISSKGLDGEATFESGVAAGHKFEDMITNNLKYQASAADCVNPAKFYYSCSVCGEKGTETFAFGDPKGHTEVVDAAVAATCTTAGKTEGKHCSVCNTVTVAQTDVPVKGHTEVIDKAVAATCTTAGKTEGKHCSVCNTVTVAQTEVKALGHKEVVDAAVAATCTTAGKTEGKHCSVCNAVLMQQGTIPALGHREVVDAAVAATCTTAGKTEGKHCSVCNTVTVAQTEVKALGHKFDKESATDAYKATDATCTDKATFYKSCSVCGVKGTETFASGDLAAHAAEDLVKLEAVAPTCTETGLTEGEMCSKCNATTKAQDTVAANGHVAGDWVVETEPKIGKEGKQYKACTVCSSIVEIEAIPAKSALPIILIIVAVVVVGGGVGVFFVLKNKKED